MKTGHVLLGLGIYLLWRRRQRYDDWYEGDGQVVYIPVAPVPSENDVMRFREIMMSEGQSQGIEPAVIASIIAQESEGIPSKVNGAYIGLMQISLETAAWRGYSGNASGLLDPATNIKWGTNYLAYQYKRYGGITDAIAAYNAGRVRYDASGNYTNQSYVNGVFSMIPRFRGLFASIYAGYARIFLKGQVITA